MWRSLVARFVRDEEAAGSNPVIPTKMQKLKLTHILLLAVLTAFFYPGLVNAQSSGTGKEKIRELTILHWNDLHARNMPYKVTKKNDTVSYYIGGISNMLGYIKKNRTKNSLVLNAGDDFQGSPISTITRGRSQIELLNLFGLDAFVIGNHEFDYGRKSLDSSLKNANFDFLSANVYVKPEKKTAGKPFIIKKINGIKCGIIGITAPDLMTLTLPANVSDVVMLNIDSVISASVKHLKKKKCDLIILLTHVGVDNDIELAEKFNKDVDIIIGGHSHTPLFEPEIVNGVIVAQAGSYSRWLGKIDLKIDVKKDTIKGFQSKLIETVMDSSVYDINAQKKVESMLASVEGELMKVIGTLETDWKRGYSTESNIGQWEADAVRKKLGTDITFLNAGGIRKDLAKGNITINDVWEINPFGNTIVTFNLTGKGLMRLISNNIKNYVKEIDEKGSSDLIIVSGMKIKYDSKKVLDGSDDFILEIKVNDEDIDESRNYSISTNNYVGSQFKKYFGEVSEKIEIKDSNIIDRDLLIEAIEKEKIINSILEKRVEDVSNQEIKRK